MGLPPNGKAICFIHVLGAGDFSRRLTDWIERHNLFASKKSSSEKAKDFENRGGQLNLPEVTAIYGQGFTVSVATVQNRNIPRQVSIALDCLGSRRIFYRHTDRWIAWSTDLTRLSKLRCLLGDEPAALESKYFLHYLKYLNFPAQQGAPMAGVGCIPPGCILQADRAKTSIRPYWRPQFEPQLNKPAEAWKRVKSKLTAAVEESGGALDEPVGVLLSGGLDSTLLLSLLRAGGRDIWTYAVGFAGEDDERADAVFAARRFQSRHRTLELHPQDVEPLLWKVTRATGCPSGNPSSLALYLAAETARTDIQQLFSGIGGDELFCGHRKHVLARYWHAARPMLNLLRRCRQVQPDYYRFGVRPVKRYPDLYAFFADEQLRSMLKSADIDCDPQPNKEGVDDRREHAIFLTDLFLWLAGGVLPQSTAVAAACGLALKTPFCSAAMVELAARIPMHLKVRGNTGKWILRQAFSEALPARVLKKRRRGFTLPLGKWLRGPLASLLDRYLHPDVLRSRDLLKPESIQRMIQVHRRGRLDLSLPLWALISLEVWQRIFIDGQTPPFESDR